MRVIAASTSSVGEACPERTSSACAVASRKARSVASSLIAAEPTPPRAGAAGPSYAVRRRTRPDDHAGVSMSKLRVSMTLPGAISLGAYEGGALAALLVAAKALGEDLVVVDSIAAASAGSITALLVARSLLRNVDPVTLLTKAWVELDSFNAMKTHSLDSPLSSDSLSKIAAATVGPDGVPDGPAVGRQQQPIHLSFAAGQPRRHDLRHPDRPGGHHRPGHHQPRLVRRGARAGRRRGALPRDRRPSPSPRAPTPSASRRRTSTAAPTARSTSTRGCRGSLPTAGSGTPTAARSTTSPSGAPSTSSVASPTTPTPRGCTC